MSKKELSTFQKDIVLDSVTKFCEYFDKSGEDGGKEVEVAKALLEVLENSSWVELDIYGSTIKNAIISTVYRSGVDINKFKENKEFEQEQFSKQAKYKKCYNEIFELGDDTEFFAALSVYPTE